MEQNILTAFIVSGLAGLTTMLGTVILFFMKKTNTKILSLALGFSAGAMIFISFVDIIPTATDQLLTSFDEKTSFAIAIASFFGGIILMALIDKFIPEESNPHEMASEESIHDVYKTSEGSIAGGLRQTEMSSLKKMGFFTALAMAIHNFPEGIATFISTVKDPKLGLPIAVAIAIHNIPEGISVAVPIYYGSGSKKEAFLYSFISSIAEPIGGLFAYFVFLNNANDTMIGIIFASVAGIMTFISLDELLPAAEEYGNHHSAIYGTIFGMAFMALSLVLMA